MDSDDSSIVAARMNRDAAEQMSRAADRIEAATHRLALLFEDGYGGNGLRLLEALDKLETVLVKELERFKEGALKLTTEASVQHVLK